MRPYLDGYLRAVFFERETGYAVDMSNRHFASNTATPDERFEYFETGRGDAVPMSRRHLLEMDVIDPISARHLDLMKRATDGRPGSPRLLGVEGILLGATRHCVWYEPTALGLATVRQGFGGFAPVSVRMVSNVFEPAIWQDESLIHGIPWHRQEAIYNDELDSYILPGPATYEGPFWHVPDGAEVDIMGTLTGGTAVLDVVAPLGTAVVRIGPTPGISGTLKAFDFDGVEIGSWSAGAMATLPLATWSLRITITAATVQPRLLLVSAGYRLPPRVAGEDLS